MKQDNRTVEDLINMDNNDEGYTKFSKNNKTYSVHKVIGNILFADLPTIYNIHHRDGNKKNNNPLNLEPMLKSDHCKKHNYGKWMLGKKASEETKEKHRLDCINRIRTKEGRFI